MGEEQVNQQRVFLSRSELKALGIPGSNVTWLRNEQRLRFPKRVRIGGTRVAWLRTEVMTWIEERKSERARHVYSEY